MFKDIALTITGTTCLEEPLKSTVTSMMSSSDSSTYTSSGGNDGGYEDWKVVLVTATVCLGVAAIAGFVYHRYRSEKDSGIVRLIVNDSESRSDDI
jgi:hypothetical protein